MVYCYRQIKRKNFISIKSTCKNTIMKEVLQLHEPYLIVSLNVVSVMKVNELCALTAAEGPKTFANGIL